MESSFSFHIKQEPADNSECSAEKEIATSADVPFQIKVEPNTFEHKCLISHCESCCTSIVPRFAIIKTEPNSTLVKQEKDRKPSSVKRSLSQDFAHYRQKRCRFISQESSSQCFEQLNKREYRKFNYSRYKHNFHSHYRKRNQSMHHSYHHHLHSHKNSRYHYHRDNHNTQRGNTNKENTGNFISKHEMDIIMTRHIDSKTTKMNEIQSTINYASTFHVQENIIHTETESEQDNIGAANTDQVKLSSFEVPSDPFNLDVEYQDILELCEAHLNVSDPAVNCLEQDKENVYTPNEKLQEISIEKDVSIKKTCEKLTNVECPKSLQSTPYFMNNDDLLTNTDIEEPSDNDEHQEHDSSRETIVYPQLTNDCENVSNTSPEKDDYPRERTVIPKVADAQKTDDPNTDINVEVQIVAEVRDVEVVKEIPSDKDIECIFSKCKEAHLCTKCFVEKRRIKRNLDGDVLFLKKWVCKGVIPLIDIDGNEN